jgi:hypothetical protein
VRVYAHLGIYVCARVGDRLIRPGTYRGHHSIPQSRHCLDVSGLLGVVAEQTAERCHSLVDGVWCDGYVRPYLVEQVIDAHDLAGVLGETQQQSHRPHLDPSGLSISRNLAGRRTDGPGADAKHCSGRAFHAGSITTTADF